MKDGSTVIITIDQEEYGRFNLATDQTIPIIIDGKEENTLVINDRAAFMTSATCPDQLCIHQGAIQKAGQTIVCLPHKVVVSVIGRDASELDSISR